MVWVSWIAASRGLAVSQRGGPDHNKATSRPGTDPDLTGLTIGRRIRPPVRRSLSGSFMSFVSQAVPGGRALGQPAVIALALCAGACAAAQQRGAAGDGISSTATRASAETGGEAAFLPDWDRVLVPAQAAEADRQR